MLDEVCYPLEDGLEYVLVDKVDYKKEEYLILSQKDNLKNIVVRKVEDNKLTTIDEEDFINVLGCFVNKNKDLFE